MPDLIGPFAHGNANVFLGSIDTVEQAKLNRSRRFRKERKVDTIAHPCRAEGIWITEPGSHRSHKRDAAHLSGMQRPLAIANDEITTEMLGN
jgi:hypothetical protein